ncbi:MAG: phosphohydrolase, partial [Treponema sp.]|nr:phosphohydrolase [Treponema sp.]
MDQLIRAFSAALDYVEKDLLGASTNHGKRIAVLCSAMGRYFDMGEEDLGMLASCAMLHDNAL